VLLVGWGGAEPAVYAGPADGRRRTVGGVPLPDVPDAGDDAVPDPLLDRLRAPNPLPAYYLPAAMPGTVHGWRRAAAWLVVAMLVSAASAGICLTYGPDELWRALGVT
jgi:hypothetical protein